MHENNFGDEYSSLSLFEYPFRGYAQYFGVKQDCSDKRSAILHAAAVITIKGRIEQGDSEKFRAVAGPFAAVFDAEGYPQACGEAIVMLDSHGGELREAIAIGREIARMGFPTMVGPEGSCLSSCVLVLLGGSYAGLSEPSIWAFTGAEIGIHQPQFDPTEREREILRLIPEAQRIDQSFALAGEEWKNITRYVIAERRNGYLMQRLLTSPQAAGEFEYLDTFEEFYFAGINPIDTRLLRMPREELGLALEASAELDSEMAHLVCSLPLIKDGLLADFSSASATPIGHGWVVGLHEIGKFCYAAVRHSDVFSCQFDSRAFQRAGNEPSWIAQWGFGVMGLYSTGMFDFSAGVTAPPTGAEMTEIADLFNHGFADGDLCASHRTFFAAHELTAFSKRMRIASDCDTPTRLCESAVVAAKTEGGTIDNAGPEVNAQGVASEGRCYVYRGDEKLDDEPCEQSARTDVSLGLVESYLWPSGSKTIVIRNNGEVTVNGAATNPDTGVRLDVDFCYRNENTGNTFCFGRR